MRYLELLLLSLYVSAPIVHAAPHALPKMEALAPIRQALNTATEAIQGATKGMVTNMAGGMAGGVVPNVAKRQSDGPVGLNLVGLLNTKKPGLGVPENLAPAMDLLKTVQDPAAALEKVPLDGLVKRILGGLGGLLGPLQGLTSIANPTPPPKAPPKAPPPVADPRKDAKKPASPQAKEGNVGPEAKGALGEARSKAAPGSAGKDTITGSPEFDPNAEGGADELLPIPGFPTAGKTNSDISTDTNAPPAPVTKTTVWNDPRAPTMGNNEVFKRFIDLLESKNLLEDTGAAGVVKTIINAPDLTGIPGRKIKRETVEKRVLPGVDPLGPVTGRLAALTQTLDSVNTLTGGLGGNVGKKGGKA
ncbi:hypothetical protein DFH27DRAFT_55930 [Peziza echinospora]|nr:hypothetical protein DFH27DRAFT_55930 [Peziza echinospora]